MKVYTKSTFNYNGVDLEPGEVFELIGARNDSKLVDLKYVVPFEEQTIDCTCGKHFMGDESYYRHLRSPKHPKESINLDGARRPSKKK